MLFFVAENKRTCVFEKKERECVRVCAHASVWVCVRVSALVLACVFMLK